MAENLDISTHTFAFCLKKEETLVTCCYRNVNEFIRVRLLMFNFSRIWEELNVFASRFFEFFNLLTRREVDMYPWFKGRALKHLDFALYIRVSSS